MLSQRKEHFRFSFIEPIEAVFRIIRISDQVENSPFKSSAGKIEIVNISPGGLKIRTVYDIPINKPIFLEFNFTIHKYVFTLVGKVAWREKADGLFYYGIKLTITPDLKRKITDEVKSFSSRQHRLKQK